MAAVVANISTYSTTSGQRRYRVRITNRRFRKHASKYNRAGFRSRREAEQYARQIQQQIARLEEGDVELGYTLQQLIERYLEDALPQLNAKDQRGRPKQLEWWREQLGGQTLLAAISPRRISAALRVLSLKTAGRAPRGKRLPPAVGAANVSGATINRYRAALSALFAFAVKDIHWLRTNPVHDTRTAKEAAGRIRWLEPEEIRCLGAAIDSMSGHLPLLFWLALSTGARLGELLAARWSDVQFTRDNGATLLLPTSKNGEPRVLPITLPKVVHLLRQQRLRYGALGERIFVPENNGRRPSRWRKDWAAALQAAGIEDFRFHDLRHCFASYLAMQGHDIIQIADLTGHRSLAMVRRYAHLNPKARRHNALSAVTRMGLTGD